MTTLTFQDKTLSIINHNSQTYFTAREIGSALGYRNPLGDISKIYDRNKDEFTPCMTTLVDMPTAGGIQKVRIFNLRGCHLIGMLSHTKVAKEFRRWVLDILDKEAIDKETTSSSRTIDLAQQALIRQVIEARGGDKDPNLFKFFEGMLEGLLDVPHYTQIKAEDFDKALRMVENIVPSMSKRKANALIEQRSSKIKKIKKLGLIKKIIIG